MTLQRIGKLIDFPVFRQMATWDCGASALQAILAFYNIDEREEVIMKNLGTNEENGTTVPAMLDVARNVYDLKCVSKNNMTLSELKNHIDNDHPIICLIQAWPEDPHIDLGKSWSEGHFVVAIGYTRGKMIFEDPSSINRTYIEENEFVSRWRDFDIDTTITGKKKLGSPGGRTWPQAVQVRRDRDLVVYRRWGLIFFDESKYNRRRITRLG